MLTVQKPYDPESFNDSEYPDYHQPTFKLPSPTLSSESSKSENLSSLDEDYVLEFINTELVDKNLAAHSGGTPEMNGFVCKKETTPDFIPSPQHSSFHDISAEGTHSSISGSNLTPNLSGIITGTESDPLSSFDAQTSRALQSSVDESFLNLIPDFSIPPPCIPTPSTSGGSDTDSSVTCPGLTQPALTNVMMPTNITFDPTFDLNNFAAVFPPNQLSPILSLPSTSPSSDAPVSTVALSCEKLLADKKTERTNKKRKTSDESVNDGFKPSKPKLSPEEKKQQRLIKNRQAALESRKRQKEHVESLESHAHQLIEENKNLHQQIALLNSQISFLTSLNPSFATSTPIPTPPINPAVAELEGLKSENAKLTVENQQLKSENDELSQKNKELEMLLNICSVPQLPHILPKSSTINVVSTIPSSSIPMVPTITRRFDAIEPNVAHDSELTAAAGTTRTRGKPNMKKLSAAFLVR
ncbi:hypothetical protein BKA69DRAFT_198385 [Paraphysoderma sedebokerense]|nr:hypothetical protein BKA69DRAFT_198385 [Paraphysoderma sedebokerense]